MGSKQKKRIAKLETMNRHLLNEREGLLLALMTLRQRVTDMHASLGATAQENVDLKHRVRVLQQRGEEAVAWVALKHREHGPGYARLLRAEFTILEDEVRRQGSHERRADIAQQIAGSIVVQLARRYEAPADGGKSTGFSTTALTKQGVSPL